MAGGLSHQELEELISADVLDGLDDADRRFLIEELGRHGPDCEECAQLITEYSEVAARLAVSLDSVAMSAGAEERLLLAARGPEPSPLPEEPGSVEAVAEGAPTAKEAPISVEPSPAAARRAGGRRLSRRWMAAAGVAAVVAVLAGLIGYQLAPGAPPAAQSQFFAFASQPGSRLVSFPPRDGEQLAVVFRPGQRQAWVIGSGVATPQSSKVYELWFRPTGGMKMMPAGTFLPSDGRVLSPTQVGTSFDTLAVTVEPQGGSPQPTSNPIYVTTVTA